MSRCDEHLRPAEGGPNQQDVVVFSDAGNTYHEYLDRAPYALLKTTGPAPKADETGVRAVTSYTYDEGMTGFGLWQEVYLAERLGGLPRGVSMIGTLNKDWGTGHPAGEGIGDNGWSVRWSGNITSTKGDTYVFRLTANDGARLIIDGSTVIDCWTACGTPATGKKWLSGNKPTSVVVEMHEHDGSANLKLEWDQGVVPAVWEVIPTARLAPNLNLATTVTDPAGSTTSSYPSALYRSRRLPQTVQRGSRYNTYVYDADYGRVLTDTDALGGVITYTYSTISETVGDCVSQQTDRTAAITKYSCNPAGDITQIRQGIRNVANTKETFGYERLVDVTYDELGRELTRTVPHTVISPIPYPVTKNIYDAAGRLTSVEDPMANVTDFTYLYLASGSTKLDQLPDPDGATPFVRPETLHTFDSVGNEITTLDARGKTWTREYDAMNRPVETGDPLGNKVRTNYSLARRATTVTDLGANGVLDSTDVHTSTVTDMLGRKVSESVGDLNATSYEYDGAGNVSKVTDPAEITVENIYNMYGQVIEEKGHMGPSGEATTTYTTYDLRGNVWKSKDANNKETVYTNDAAGRLLTATLPNGLGVWTHVYNDAGERIKASDGEQRVREWWHDDRGRLKDSYDGLNRLTVRGYDNNNRLKWVDDPRAGGPEQNFEYDTLGRRTKRHGTTLTTDVETFTYDPAGNMLTAVGSGFTATLAYDDAGRIASITEDGKSSAYTYQGSQLTSVTDTAGTTSYAFRAEDGLLSSLTDPFGTTATTYGYDTGGSGRPVTRTDPSGVVTTLTYEAASGRIDRQDAVRSGTTLASFDLGYDAVSNVASKDVLVSGYGAADNGTWSYQYDEINRMTKATDPTDAVPIVTDYGYDKAGNRTSVKVGVAPAVTTTFNAANLPTSSNDGTTFSHDELGRLTLAADPVDSWSYSYDTWSRMTTAAGTAGAPTISFSYDALNRTLRRTKLLEATSYAYRGISEDVIASTVGTATTLYAHGAGGPLATKASDGAVRYFMQDLHDDVVGLVAKTGGTVDGTAAFDPWGEKRATTGIQSILGFQGDMTDADTGLVDMLTRLYDPARGRFMTQDVLFGEPTRPTSLNLYAYGEGSPVRFSDPTGMVIIDGMGGPRPPIYGPTRDDLPQRVSPQASTPTVSQSRIELANSLAPGARVRMLANFFGRFPGTAAAGTGFGMGILAFTRWEVGSSRLNSRHGSRWWRVMNGLLVLDIRDAGTALARGEVSSRNPGVQGWMDYALTSGGGSRSRQQAAFWEAHQTSLHGAVPYASHALKLERSVNPGEGRFIEAAMRFVDTSAIYNMRTDTGFLEETLGLYPGYPATAAYAGLAESLSGLPSSFVPTDNIGLGSTQW